MDFFGFFGLLAALYGAWSLYTGEVSGRQGWGWGTWSRRREPFAYWLTVGSYITIGIFAVLVLPAMK